MSVRPYHPKKAKPGETWWIIDVGRASDRQQIPFNGSFENAAKLEQTTRERAGGENKFPSPAGNTRIKDLVLPFLRWYATESSPRTVRDIRFTIDLYIVPIFGNLIPAHLTVQLFTSFKEELLQKGISPTTIN